MPDDPQRLRIICYMTDGFVGNDMQIIDYIRKNRGRARMFPFGIGNSVNRFLLEQMAREGRGAAEIVTLDMSQEQLNQLWDSQDAGNATEQEQAINRRINSMSSASNAAERFYRRIAQPVLLNPEVSWNGLPVADVYPRQIPDVFTSGPVVLRGRYTGAADGYITVSGILRGKPWQQKIHVKFPESNSAGAGLPSLWARARIEELQSRDWLGAQSGNPDAAIKEQIVQTALNYRLMSQFTSFVAVQEKVVNRGGVQQTVDVPIELAEGLDRQGVGSSARRARNSGGSFRVAAGQRFSGRAGDPLISVEAPSDAKRVVALLPGGEVKKLLWNVENHKWEARFDIPTYAPEGEYSITVIVVRHDDKRTRLVLRYHVDMTAPQGKGAARVAGSSQGRSASQPQRSLHLELEASAGTARVMALLPWGDKVEMKAGSNARNRFATVVQPPPHWTSSQGAVTYILTDRAHNRTSVTVDLSK
jgi:Ca-activated chloride channel family protein